MNNNSPKKEHMSFAMMVTIEISVFILAILIVVFAIVNIAGHSSSKEKTKGENSEAATTSTELEVIETTETTNDDTASLETKSAEDLTIPEGVQTPTFAYETPFELTVANTEGYGLSMRKGASTSDERIKRINDGEKVTVLGSTSTTSVWYYVEYDGEYGWCCSVSDGVTFLEK